jgi:hypothetical protein
MRLYLIVFIDKYLIIIYVTWFSTIQKAFGWLNPAHGSMGIARIGSHQA